MPAPRKPAAVQELSGAWQKNPQRRREEFEAGDIGDCPKHLTKEQKATWREIAGLFPEGVLQRTDRVTLETMACLLVKQRQDDITNAERGQLIKLLGQMGMTPTERSKVAVPAKKKQDDGFEMIPRAH